MKDESLLKVIGSYFSNVNSRAEAFLEITSSNLVLREQTRFNQIEILILEAKASDIDIDSTSFVNSKQGILSKDSNLTISKSEFKELGSNLTRGGALELSGSSLDITTSKF